MNEFSFGKQEEEAESVAISYYQALNDPTCQYTAEITEFFNDFYTKSESFQILIHIIQNSNVESVKNHAIIGIGHCIKFLLVNSLIDPQICIIELLKCISFQNSEFIKRNAQFYMTSILRDYLNEHLSIMIQYIDQIVQQQVQIESVLRILTIIYSCEADLDIQRTQWTIELISKAFMEEHAVDLKEVASLCALQVLPFLYDDLENMILPIFESLLQYCQLLIQTNDGTRFERIFYSFINFLSMNPAPDSETFLNTFLPLATNESTDTSIKRSILLLIDAELLSYPMILSETSVASYLLQVYSLFTVNSFENGEVEDGIFSDLIPALLQTEEASSLIDSHITSLEQTPAQLFVLAQIIDSIIIESPTYFSGKLEWLFETFSMLMEIDDYYIQEIISRIISEFANGNSNLSYSFLIEKVFPKISIVPQYISTLSSLFESSIETDSIFSQSINLLTSILSQVQDIFVQTELLSCLSSLVKRSQTELIKYFDQIVPFLIDLLQNDDSSIQSSSIICLSYFAKCSDKFDPLLGQLLEIIAQNTNSHLQHSCIVLFDSIDTYFNKNPGVQTLAPNMVQVLLALSSQESEDYDQEEDEEFEFQNTIYSAAAITALCHIFSLHYNELFQVFDQIMQILEYHKAGGNGDLIIACADGLCHISSAQISDDQAVRIYSLALSMIKNSSDSETCGKSFQVLTNITRQHGLMNFDDTMLCLEMIFNGELFFQRGKVQYIPVLFNKIYEYIQIIEQISNIELPVDLLEHVHSFFAEHSNQSS